MIRALKQALARRRLAKRCGEARLATQEGGQVTNETGAWTVEWRIIPSFPLYAASSEGEIRRVRQSTLKPILRPSVDRKGYAYVGLYDGKGAQRMRPVSRLVCEAFHGAPPSEKLDAAHNDGNPSNNRPSNLRWATRLENMADTLTHGTRILGEKNHMARLDQATVKRIRAAYTGKRGEINRLAEEVGVHAGTILAVVANRTWFDPEYARPEAK